MSSKLRDQLRSRKWWLSWVYIFSGCFLLAAGYVLFISPYNIVPGGVYGAGIVLNYLYDKIEVGTYGLMLDIPLLITGIIIFGKMFGGKTVIAAVVTPMIMNAGTRLIGDNPELMFGGAINLSGDLLVACIIGGVIIGVGVGMIIKGGATSGGTDIVAMIIATFTKFRFSQGVLMIDSVVVIFGLIIFQDWRLPLYSILTIYVITKGIDFVLEGTSTDKLLFIISDKREQLRDFIINDLDRGGTYIHSSGMYTENDREMIFLVISRREISAVQNKIKQIDPLAFLVVVNAHETFGEGFKPFTEQE